jgi:hypothetical protein
VLEDATNTKSHGNQRLHVQWWKAPDDGHNSVRNMYSDIDCNKKIYDFKTEVHLVGFYSILYILHFCTTDEMCALQEFPVIIVNVLVQTPATSSLSSSKPAAPPLSYNN